MKFERDRIYFTVVHIFINFRFHIETRWNYKIPQSPCDKGYRALYRAFSHYSAMQDISFFSCLEIQGPGSVICEAFKSFSSPLVNKLSIGAAFYTSGEREGCLHFYKQASYPYGYIGQITFLWNHYSSLSTSILWLWVHPGYKEQVLEALTSVFELELELKFHKTIKMETDEKRTIDEIKLDAKKLKERPVWKNEVSQVLLTDLEGCINRIRLYGPESTRVLKEILHTKTEVVKTSNSTWVHDYYTGEKEEILVKQNKLWSLVTSFQDFPAHVVLPLTVRDVRVFLPRKRLKSVSKIGEMEPLFPELLQDYLRGCQSPLSVSEWRDRVIEEKMSDVEFTKRRSQLLIPGKKFFCSLSYLSI